MKTLRDLKNILEDGSEVRIAEIKTTAYLYENELVDDYETDLSEYLDKPIKKVTCESNTMTIYFE